MGRVSLGFVEAVSSQLPVAESSRLKAHSSWLYKPSCNNRQLYKSLSEICMKVQNFAGMIGATAAILKLI
jgi:hypothetical protein